LRAVLCLLLYAAGWLGTWIAGVNTGMWIFAAACLPGGWGLAKESWDDLILPTVCGIGSR